MRLSIAALNTYLIICSSLSYAQEKAPQSYQVRNGDSWAIAVLTAPPESKEYTWGETCIIQKRDNMFTIEFSSTSEITKSKKSILDANSSVIADQLVHSTAAGFASFDYNKLCGSSLSTDCVFPQIIFSTITERPKGKMTIFGGATIGLLLRGQKLAVENKSNDEMMSEILALCSTNKFRNWPAPKGRPSA